jgi:hypothetical protein
MAILPLLLGASIAATQLPHAAPVVPPAAVPAAVAPHPALWVVNDKDTVIYLFGTFHALDGKSDWFEQAVKTAFLSSDQLMLETLVPRPGEPLPMPGSGPVRVTMPPNGQPPAPMAQLAPSASFLATTKLVMTAGRSKGLSTDRGADEVLREAADEIGKPVGGLESFQYQLNMFSSLPPAANAAPQDPKTVQALAGVLTQLEDGWSHGRVEETFTPLLRQMQTQSPEIYQKMFVERNARWAQWIAERLKKPGVVFVAVGAGHLSGPDSVQNQLAALGVKSARIN